MDLSKVLHPPKFQTFAWMLNASEKIHYINITYDKLDHKYMDSYTHNTYLNYESDQEINSTLGRSSVQIEQQDNNKMQKKTWKAWENKLTLAVTNGLTS